MTVEEFASRFDAKKVGDRWTAHCPCHEDKNGSLSIKAGDGGRVLMHCFAGCANEDIVKAKGLTMHDMFSDSVQSGKVSRVKVAEYTYYTRDGKPLVKVLRYKPKSFSRQSWDGCRWIDGNTSNVAALYRWPELRAACNAHVKRVLLVEGEKDVDNMVKLLAAAPKDDGGKPIGAPFDEVTTALGGSSKWRMEYAPEFAGIKEVVVIADRDGAGNKFKGQRYAIQVRDALRENNISAKAVLLPAEIGGKGVKDASDALAAGWGLADFGNWLAAAADLNAADFEQKAEAPSDDGSMKSAIEAAVLEAYRQQDGGRLKERDEAEVVSRVGRDWLTKHGRFYLDRDAKGIHGTYYFYATEKRLFWIGGGPDESAYFNAWLSIMAGRTRARNIFRQLLIDCQTDATASDMTTEFTPSRFWEKRGDMVYISCGEGQMCRIKAGGSPEMVDNGTDGVLFLSDDTLKYWRLLPFEESKSPFDLAVFRDMSVEEERYKWAFLFWLLAVPLCMKNKPPLALVGEVGGGKTKLARALFEMFGLPDERISTISDCGSDTFWKSVDKGGLWTLDNIDEFVKWLDQCIDGYSTGGTQEVKTLYTTKGTTILYARASLILTSANPTFAGKASTADRLVLVRMRRRDRQSTKDSELSEDIVQNRDACMTWIAHVLQAALDIGNDRPPQTCLNYRHPDWGAWAWRFAKVLGCEAYGIQVLGKTEADKAKVFVENDQLAGELRDYLKKNGKVTATAAGLVELLRKNAEAEGRSFKFSAKSVGKRINNGWYAFAAMFNARKDDVNHDNVIYYTFYPARDDSASADDPGAVDGGGSAVGDNGENGNGNN